VLSIESHLGWILTQTKPERGWPHWASKNSFLIASRKIQNEALTHHYHAATMRSSRPAMRFVILRVLRWKTFAGSPTTQARVGQSDAIRHDLYAP